MSTQTPNLNLDLREGTDIFNPLSTNANFETLDSVITEIRKKGGVPTYTTTASANLLKLSENPVPNETLFKFVAAGDANTWSYQETVNNIVALDGSQKTIKGGEMYVAWVNAANAMVVIAWPDVVNAQTFDGKEPAEWSTKAQLDAVNQTAANATTTAQAAATVANQALDVANKAGFNPTVLWENPNPYVAFSGGTVNFTRTLPVDYKYIIVEFKFTTTNDIVYSYMYRESKPNGNYSFHAAVLSYSPPLSMYTRDVSQLKTNSCVFSSGMSGAIAADLSNNNSVMIPYRVMYI